MPAKIKTNQTSLSGATLYAFVEKTDGTRWNGTGFESVQSAHWSTYVIAMTEASGTGQFVASVPAGINTATLLDVTIFRRLGGSPATTDPVVGIGELDWTGSDVASFGTPCPLVDATNLGRAPTRAEAAALSAAGEVGTIIVQTDGSGILYHLDGTSIARTFTVDEMSPPDVNLNPEGLDNVDIEPGINARQALSAIGAATTGVLNGVGTGTIVIYAMGGSGVPRVNMKIATTGDRSTSTLSLPN